MIRLMNFLLVSLLFLCMQACETLQQRGNHFEIEQHFPALKVGLTYKADVQDKLGSPSFKTAYGKNSAWFYYGYELNNFVKAKLVNQTCYQFIFDDYEQLLEIKQYDLQDMNELDFIKETTPHLEHGNTIFQKLYGNLGVGNIQD